LKQKSREQVIDTVIKLQELAHALEQKIAELHGQLVDALVGVEE